MKFYYHLLNGESRIKNKMESNVEALRKFGIKERKIREIGIERKFEESKSWNFYYHANWKSRIKSKMESNVKAMASLHWENLELKNLNRILKLYYHLLNCESRIKNKIESNVEALRKFGIKKRKIRKIGIERKLEESNPEILLSFIKLRK